MKWHRVEPADAAEMIAEGKVELFFSDVWEQRVFEDQLRSGEVCMIAGANGILVGDYKDTQKMIDEDV